MAAPVEKKVQASTAAAAVSGLALWALGRYVFSGDVPDVVASWVYVIVPGVITFAAGYLAKHTDRTPAAPPLSITMPGTISEAEAADIKRRFAAAMKPGADVSPLPDPPMQDLPGPASPVPPGGTP